MIIPSLFSPLTDNLHGMEIFLAPELEIQKTTPITKVIDEHFIFNFTLVEVKESRFVTVIRPNSRDFFVICELSVYGGK